MTTPYLAPDGKTWQLDHPFLDAANTAWTWDGKPFTEIAGPELQSMSASWTHAPLLRLAAKRGLWQVSLTYPELAHLMDPMDRYLTGLVAGPEVRP